MTEHLMIKAVMLVGLGMSAGCARDQGEAQGSQSGTEPAIERSSLDDSSRDKGQPALSQQPLANDLWIPLPKKLQLPGLSNVQSASSWSARLARLPKPDQAYLTEISERYFGTLEFQSQQEQLRLIQQGFPMPEEWLAARGLPDAELKRLAKDGNLKAQMFWIDRIARKIGPIRATRGLGNTPADKELFGNFAAATVMADNLMRVTRSPFGAYLAGRLYSAGAQGNPPEYLASAFQLAEDLGDERADQYRSIFFQKNPGVDAGTVMSLYSSMKSGLQR